MASQAAALNDRRPGGATSAPRAVGDACARMGLVALAGLSLSACRPQYERSMLMDAVPRVGEDIQPSLVAETTPAVPEPRTHARSHVLLGIDFTRPLQLPECARYYDRFDRPETTCVYLGKLDHRPFKIEFKDGSVPAFLKWSTASVATDERGRPQMIRFDIGNDPAQQGQAVDAMLEKFGPPSSVENASGMSKVGTWRHQDYVIQYFFDPNGAIVQMETKRFHDDPTAAADPDSADRAKL
jgi:hypothetical protein